jgi:HTH-type transcriptional regulator/antitoxin HigA
MQIRPIRTNKDHRAALAEIENLWGASSGTPEGDKLDILVTLVETYEERRWPLRSRSSLLLWSPRRTVKRT